MSEYLSGAELRNIYAKLSNNGEFSTLEPFTKQVWNDLADIIKAPRPPKPKTLCEVYCEWYGNYNEKSLERLRVLLNEAREKLDGAKGGGA